MWAVTSVPFLTPESSLVGICFLTESNDTEMSTKKVSAGKKKVENIDNLIKSCGRFCFLTIFSVSPVLPHTYSVHASGFPILATKPHQQGGNDPATTAVMMESVGALTCSLALSNKSPNSSVYISADPANRSNAPIRGLSPHASFHLSLRCENCCWLPHSMSMVLPEHVQDESKDRHLAPRTKSVDQQWIRRKLV